MTQVTLPEEGIDVLFGTHDENLRRMERAFQVELSARGNELQVSGSPEGEEAVRHLLQELRALVDRGYAVRPNDVRTAIRVVQDDPRASLVDFFLPTGMLAAANRLITPRTLRQQAYLKAMIDFDIVISIGPAGTGKTYLAVATAVEMMSSGHIERIILSRPAVEAGERLGFLPGDLRDKVDPYLRPLYDALHDMLPAEQVMKRLENGEIEIAPLAFMRGRTLSHAFIILDEAQNTTAMQMKMFLTRIGEGSRMAVTGDLSQIDLPDGVGSGLQQSVDLLEGIKGVATIRFTDADVVRHPLVTRIVRAYDQAGSLRRGQDRRP